MKPQASPFIYLLMLEIMEGRPVLTEASRYDYLRETKGTYILREQFDKREETLSKRDLDQVFYEPSCSVSLYRMRIYCLAENKLRAMRQLKSGAEQIFSKRNEGFMRIGRAELKKLKW